LGDTWEWDGTDWTERTTPGPPARVGAAMEYDGTRRVVVLHGGFAGGDSLEDTWEWDGTAWTERVLEPHPPKRGSHAMVYDARRGRLVMFGGIDYTPTTGMRYADTWTF